MRLGYVLLSGADGQVPRRLADVDAVVGVGGVADDPLTSS